MKTSKQKSENNSINFYFDYKSKTNKSGAWNDAYLKEVFHIFKQMLSVSKRIGYQIEEIRDQLAKLPKGNLSCAKNGKYYKWYWEHDGKTEYLSKSNRKLAEQLAMKKYLSLLQKELLSEQKAVQAYLAQCQKEERKSRKLFDHAEYQKLLSPYFQPLDKKMEEWVNADYQKSQKYPEQLVHKCSFGLRVRSKSEAMIATFLYLKKIPFRYECELQIEDVELYPDFTILHPQTGELCYWEHFGMMDNEDYVRGYIFKLNLYVSHGIIPSIQLITTYETKEHPLTVQTIESVIQQYFEV